MLDLLHEKKEEQIALDFIHVDGGTQMRAAPNMETVAEYATAYADGAQFPPLVVFYDGVSYWLGDGFHRIAAYERQGATKAPCEVRSGTRRDAVLYAAGANADHGLRRTNADKRRAVETLLHDGEWVEWSNREIARRCRVSEGFVRILREELTAYGTQLNGSDERKYIDRHGNEQTMKTSNIGRNAKPTTTTTTEPVAMAEKQLRIRSGVPPTSTNEAYIDRATTDAIADAWDETPPAEPTPIPDGRGRAERLHDLRGLIARLTFTLEDLELAKALLGVDHIVIIERAAAHVRLTVGKLEELKARVS